MADQDLAVTEKGSTLQKYTEADVDAVLRALILTGGSTAKTEKIVKESGISITRNAITYWRDHAFARRYFELRSELGRDVGEEIAARGMETAMKADSAEKRLIDELMSVIESGEYDEKILAPALAAVAKAKDVAIKNSQLLRDRPTEIKQTRDVPELLAILERTGVFDRVGSASPMIEPVEAESVEVEVVKGSNHNKVRPRD
jgi:hypothetical protein